MNKIVIDSDISYWGYSARWLSNKLSEMTGDLEVEISSYGGDVFEGIAMFNILRQYSKNKGIVTVTVNSHAMSIASLIFLAGDVKKSHDNSTIMIHKAWTWLAGNSDELQAESKVLDGIDAILAKQYSKYMQESEDEIMQIMSNEGWYIGKDQLEKTGFIDEFIPSEDEVDVSAKSSYKTAMSRFSAKAQAENVKPNFDEVKASILECNDGKCPMLNSVESAKDKNLKADTLAVVPTVSDIKTTNLKQGADMKWNSQDLQSNEEPFNVLVANRDTLQSRIDRGAIALETANATLETTQEEMTALKADMETKSTEAGAKLDSFKAEAETRMREAITTGVSADTAVAMLNANSAEEASKLAIGSNESDGATLQASKDALKTKDTAMANYALDFAKKTSV